MLSLYGKLPTAGDFLTIEVPRALLRPIEDWLATSVAASRTSVEENWQERFDLAPKWCFWIGEEVLGRRIAGVLRASQDRVGRRFPVMFFTSSEDRDGVADPPVIDADMTLYRDMDEELSYLASQAPDAISARLKSVVTPGSKADAGPPPRDFWAVAAEPGESGWQAVADDAANADHALAAAARSYWWTPDGAGGNSAIYATQGLPEPHIFAWFITGLGAPETAVSDESD